VLGRAPPLVLALSEDPAADVLDGTKEIEKAPDVTVGDTAYTALKLTESSGDRVTLLIDPKTHLLRRFIADVSKTTDPEGAADVKKAEITIDYTEVEPGAQLQAERFAWTPPKGAKEVTTSTAVALGGGGDDFPALALEGKAAPDFKLPGMDGDEVSLADLKGSVVLIDFWATWCGPCRASLPQLDGIYKAKKGAGLKAFAIDLKEEKDVVEKFVKETKLTIPVLLDSEGSVAEKYQVNGIPQTVVIGKDGKVKKVVRGSGNDEAIRKAVEEAMK